ncbi:MAG: hypothetical protein V7K27_11960 [Nostoc sp.]|uniref:hypothetical protein n=1 Tax=Nostoc sp. TaxID=1180 RepID=UPI002FFB00F2
MLLIISFPVSDWECPSLRLRLSYWRQSHQDLHFQPEAGNEILNQFHLKLTPMSIAKPLRKMWFLPDTYLVFIVKA